MEQKLKNNIYIIEKGYINYQDYDNFKDSF